MCVPDYLQEMDIWIAKNGNRTSGSIAKGTFKCDTTKTYDDDGSIKAAEFAAGANEEGSDGLDLSEPAVHGDNNQ